ncbi:MAG: DNA topoisomerase IV subunit B [Candidatus Yonathbacteria bacterium CG10_big_fil_rev_8_21_14_0_10_43_136]|uniref:DNA topoisomerase (ATP-hydrolyzing) n=2 Tax=Parcubacteria group TaxID=1794811 RepID=A0A2M7Q4A8_9BACT|nr:MAG: DNA topoisomerase IV subunit B [Candidatus Nomurabacteria bacterium CG2_30_43_9]PIR40634.1 MAG: DNA topoisomerase IV subunit B [Candidatus Yonathbacteria bacterium CG10_big_fil_rev_8_21_14_0_10_43_136]PIX57171.1 MAG: DNA topoisomerase IV subunit B [Candidatus Yonathbacteria bacterium CG_4_10_14_3_um_filter_43_12]PIY58238.1 MAG: DNA topoisomerase IV subunit B [Candidatus Yonathbacteria bacterium CG_4_10_14_0_8_um_filter_43_17]PJC22409.1 MAG: DNA topoisomerase IV subunit B [Candidatus Yon
MAKKDEKIEGYGAEDIVVLEGLEPVRKRPGMYIGSTGPEGLHHLIWEIFDNSRDEAMGGFADHIEVALLPGNRVRVVDNGRGIPTDIHTKTKVSALETIMTTLHAGGKFEGTSYKVSGGLHGVGASVVNALSVYTKVEVHRDGAIHMQEYERGKRKAIVKKVGTTKFRGTIVTFEPDELIFKEMGWNWNQIVNHLRQQAYLVKGLQINIIDAQKYDGKLKLDNEVFLADFQLEVPSMSFYFDGGLVSLVRFYNQHQKPVHKNICYVEKEMDSVMVEVAFQYIDDISSRELAFANNIYNMEGGTHVTGFRTALTRRINDYARKNNFLKDADENFTADDVREGLTCAISVKMREIQFEGQTKGKLGSVEARGAVEKVFGEALGLFMEENPDDARSIVNKVILALRARKAAKAAKDSVLRKGALEGLTLPGKLADCQSNKAEDSELFIVEGDSAGGSSKQGRDRKTQAILPLKGKILNVERARLDRMLESNEIKSLVIALGVGIGDVFDMSKLRYHKIIIATDADVDGAHIRALLLTLFYRYFKQVIEGGYIYIAQPPLYKIKRGKEIKYAYSEEEKIAFLGKDVSLLEVAEDGDGEAASEGTEEKQAEAEEMNTKRAPKISLQRYKGLGEMNPEELWETTMDPKSRILKKVTIDDAVDADKAFDVLMGEDVAARKSFIQSNAKMANIDA